MKVRVMETTAIERWLHTVLNGDPALTALVGTRVFCEQIRVAEGTVAYPCVVYQMQTPRDVNGVGVVRVMGSYTYLVRAIGKEATYVELEPVADRIDALLQNQHGLLSDGRTVGCYREQAFQMAEVDNGVVYRHIGGMYRMIG